ncbi:ADP-ribosylglycohydrolase family protein, partial [Thiocapsa sp.]|uniref:ADP-ribosylglycohydrolase family protein n=1 Tax=Thiocapsa sp. TaxID=2024551 RepID=UPI002BAE8820
GDADTTGAILGMIAGALYGPDAIPRRWLGVLEKATATACLDQAAALLTASSRSNDKGSARGESHI